MSRMGHVNSKQEVLDAFRTFDSGGNGTISQQEFQTVVYNLGEQMSQQDAQEMMSEAVGQDGFVRYKNLVDMWFSFDR